MLIYLASPYSHPNAAVRQERYEAVCKVAAQLMARGHVIYSPIAHSHPVAEFLDPELLMGHGFWMKQCLPILDVCDELWVLELDGVAWSKGIHTEIQFAVEHLITVRFIRPEALP